MPWALLALSIAETLFNAALKARQNNAQTREMTPEQEAEFDAKEKAIRTSVYADPTQNT